MSTACHGSLVVQSRGSRLKVQMIDWVLNRSRLMKSLVIVLIAGLITSGCVATPKHKGVKVGMTQGEVLSIMGQPVRKSEFLCPEYARNCPEIWQYDGYNISFSDGIVDATQ